MPWHGHDSEHYVSWITAFWGRRDVYMLQMLSKDAMTLLILNKRLTENLGKNIQ